MAEPLSSLLSQTLVAFVIELDNAFEARMPSFTNLARPANADPAPPGWGRKPWLISWAMWANFLRWVEPGGTRLADIRARGRLTPQSLRIAATGMARWGYVAVDDKTVRPRAPGAYAAGVLQGLEDEVAERWRERFGEAFSSALAALGELGAALEVNAPAFMPFLGYDLLSEVAKGADDTPAGKGSPTDLISRALLAFTLAFETGYRPSLAHCANLVRVLDEAGVPQRDLPRRSGVAKAGVDWIQKQLIKSALADTFNLGAVKHVRLSAEGAALKSLYAQRVQAIEDDWVKRLPAVTRLRAALEAILASPRLPEALEPWPRGWRAQLPAIQTLPHHPMILHRGGYPDGA